MQKHNGYQTNLSIIQNNLNAISNEIKLFSKNNENITPMLIVVTKTQSIEVILAAYNYGQRIFAENYVQELVLKSNKLELFKDIAWHFIGKIQSNKIKLIANNSSWVHSLTLLKHAILLNQHRGIHLPTLQVLIEVNISKEESKSGLSTFDEIKELARNIQKLPNLKLRGLMGMASHTPDRVLINSQFALIKQYFDELNKDGFELDQLSIGMSDDYHIALKNGATMLRIGSKVFGVRN
jgi:PLP dependent protein